MVRRMRRAAGRRRRARGGRAVTMGTWRARKWRGQPREYTAHVPTRRAMGSALNRALDARVESGPKETLVREW